MQSEDNAPARMPSESCNKVSAREIWQYVRTRAFEVDNNQLDGSRVDSGCRGVMLPGFRVTTVSWWHRSLLFSRREGSPERLRGSSGRRGPSEAGAGLTCGRLAPRSHAARPRSRPHSCTSRRPRLWDEVAEEEADGDHRALSPILSFTS